MENSASSSAPFSLKTRILARLTKKLSVAAFLQLRSAIDWQDWHYNIPVKHEAYLDLRDGGEFFIAKTRVEFKSTWTDSNLILKAEGYYIRITDPSVYQRRIEDGLPVNKPPIAVQCQGHAFASGVDTFEVARDIEDMLRLHKPVRIPGRVDLACDIWIKDGACSLSANDLFDTIICEGSPVKIKQNWSTRSTRRETDATIKVDDGKTGPPSIRLGSIRTLSLRIYDKTADFPRNTKDLIIDQWIDAGFEPGNGLVCRFEFRVMREYIRKNVWDVDGKTVDGSELTLEQLHQCIPQLWATCLHRFRYCPDSGDKRKNGQPIETRKRRVAPFWDLLIDNPPVISDEYLGPLLRFKKRGYDVGRLHESTVHYLINLTEAMGIEALDLVTVQAMADTPENRDYKSKSRWTGFQDRWEKEYFDGRITTGQLNIRGLETNTRDPLRYSGAG